LRSGDRIYLACAKVAGQIFSLTGKSITLPAQRESVYPTCHMPSPAGGTGLATDGLRDLCAKIVAEKNSEQQRVLFEQLIVLLSLEQENLREQIRAQVFGIGRPKAVGK
jgi:hypothetical protein